MKTEEDILESEFATQNLTGMVRDGVIKAMQAYADQQVKAERDKWLNKIEVLNKPLSKYGLKIIELESGELDMEQTQN